MVLVCLVLSGSCLYRLVLFGDDVCFFGVVCPVPGMWAVVSCL